MLAASGPSGPVSGCARSADRAHAHERSACLRRGARGSGETPRRRTAQALSERWRGLMIQSCPVDARTKRTAEVGLVVPRGLAARRERVLPCERVDRSPARRCWSLRYRRSGSVAVRVLRLGHTSGAAVGEGRGVRGEPAAVHFSRKSTAAIAPPGDKHPGGAYRPNDWARARGLGRNAHGPMVTATRTRVGASPSGPTDSQAGTIAGPLGSAGGSWEDRSRVVSGCGPCAASA